jgi:hypothetical protein
MARAIVRLVNRAARATAAEWVWNADPDTVVTFAPATGRTLQQNAAMWAALTDVASQVDWHGQRLTTDDWKLLFLADLGRGTRMVPALDGRGYVNLNVSSSALSAKEFGELLDAIHRFADAHGVALLGRQ